MWRSQSKILQQVKLKNQASSLKNIQQTRNASANASGGGGGKFFFKAVGLTAVGAVSGIVGYAKYDPSFRTLVEDRVPYSNRLFQYTLDLIGGSDVKPAVAEEPKPVGLLAKKIERSTAESKDVTPADKIVKSEKKPVQKVQESLENVKNELKDKIDEEAEAAKLEKKLANQETEIRLKNKELEKTLKTLCEKLDEKVDSAVRYQKKAARDFRLHAEALNKALDESENDFETIDWNLIKELNDKKKEAIQKSLKSVNISSEAIAHLKDTLDEARTNRHTAANKSIFEAEDNMQAAYNRLSKSEKLFQEAQFVDKMASEYKESLERARQTLESELKAISPDFNLSAIGSNGDLTKENTNQMILYFTRKLDHFNKKMSKQQSTEQLRIKDALVEQRKEDEFVSEKTLNMELARQAREMNLAEQQKIQKMKEDFDDELRQGLRRQLTAHVEHVQQCLKTQADELHKEFKEVIDDKVLAEKGRNEKLLSSSIGKLNAIEDFLKSRESLDKAARKAKELWLACQMLKNTLKVGRHEESDMELNLKPLDSELNAIKAAAGLTNPFVRTLVESVPSEASTRGVYTEEALRERFKKVEKVCRRVAMIDETGGSLFKYFISYMQSFFIISPSVSSEEIEKDAAISPSDLGTFDIISRVDTCLQQDNLLQALKYMNLLKGEPRNVAKDWIQELRILLETRQIADALLAHAAATSVQAYH